MNEDSTDATETWTLFGALGAAVGAAVCCLGPLVLVSLGVTGAWIGRLSALEPYRPLFMVVAAVMLGLAFYRTYAPDTSRANRNENPADCDDCAAPQTNRTNRLVVWGASVAVVGLFASPYLVGSGGATPNAATAEPSPPEASEASSRELPTRRVVLRVRGMTCGGCVQTVRTALEGVDGVRDADVTLEPPRATVEFRPDDTTIRELIRATSRVGFESVSTNEHQRESNREESK